MVLSALRSSSAVQCQLVRCLGADLAVKYANNEAYFEIIEEIGAIMDYNRVSVISTEIQGCREKREVHGRENHSIFELKLGFDRTNNFCQQLIRN
ncbi:hypothetical protein JTE90_020891 [Oedothorax gibbosus]|uniref:Uncharacterized protein n=1 Tax=Oedothorax gibbosus TaxID=931172 RepID=A0AAV6UAT6_9ARAC|nr:hypothetical protein JTE90_020891 [Oedothorax gibbosus]